MEQYTSAYQHVSSKLTKIFFISILFSGFNLSLCKGQEKEIESNKKKLHAETLPNKNVRIEKLDIQEFNKHQVDGEWTFKDKKGNTIHITKDVEEYWEEVTNKNAVFTKRRNYYLNGNIKLESQYFHDSGFSKGKWTYYNEQGRRIKTEDHDSPFKNFPWEKVQQYLIKNGVDIKDNFTMVHNVHRNEITYWLLSWDTKKVNREGNKIIKNIQLDGTTGTPSQEKITYFSND